MSIKRTLRHVRRRTYKSLFLGLAFLLLSCHLEPPEQIVLRANPIASEVQEGGYIVYDLDISGALPNALVLKVTFSITAYTSDYANPEDYIPAVEYSTDSGRSWQSEPDKTTLRLLPDKGTYKIRLTTVDDQSPELLTERLLLILSPLRPEDHLRLKEPLPMLTAVIKDNDVSEELRSKIDVKSYLLVLKEEQDVFVLNGVATKVDDAKQKAIVDGEYQDLVKLISAMRSTSPIFAKTKQLLLGYKASYRTLGAVQPLVDANGQTDLSQWAMYLNLAQGYLNFETGVPQKFNTNGQLAATIVHELGHILTLNDTQRSLVLGAQDCQSLFVSETEEKSCFAQDSYVSDFLQEFYDISQGMVSPKPNLPKPDFVSLYAKTNYAEDLAESFLGYVCKPEPPPYNQTGAYANKLAFCAQYPNVRQIRDEVKQTGYVLKSNNETETPTTLTRRGGAIALHCFSEDLLLEATKPRD